MTTSYNIAVIPGDGTGPEVIGEGRKVLSAAAQLGGISLNYVDFDLGARDTSVPERYCRTQWLRT